ncbi:hypothetical protein [uncultured Pediococcus sp.]|uniref:hypothetical protein n=1 Tax=uncultured Pediococcus sp. TaxID=165192 RepID=UPI00259B369E|nr:hypothetical protein [uncultured Pediococcus sp.]
MIERVKRLRVGEECYFGISGYSVLKVSAGFIVDKIGPLFFVKDSKEAFKRIEELLKD